MGSTATSPESLADEDLGSRNPSARTPDDRSKVDDEPV